MAQTNSGPCENSEDGIHYLKGEICEYCGETIEEENPRERGDDDGVEYADPGDEMEERLLRD